jgi:hypothetical protein
MNENKYSPNKKAAEKADHQDIKRLRLSDFPRLILTRIDLRGSAVVVRKGQRLCYQYKICDKAGDLVHSFYAKSHAIVAIVLYGGSTSFTLVSYPSIAKLESVFYKRHIEGMEKVGGMPRSIYGIAYMSESNLPIDKILNVGLPNSK